jgi:hypothetical protein
LSANNDVPNEFVIDPAAEPGSANPSNVSAQQEIEFFSSAGLQYQLLHNQQNLGFLGKFFGANSSAPTNIAGFIIICSLFILFISLFAPANAELVESRKWMIGLITSALSFVFGAASKK